MSKIRTLLQFLKPWINNRKVTIFAILSFILSILKYIFSHQYSDVEISKALYITKIFIEEQCRIENPHFLPDLLNVKMLNIIHKQIFSIVVAQVFTIFLASLVAAFLFWLFRIRKNSIHFKTMVKYFLILVFYTYSVYNFMPQNSSLLRFSIALLSVPLFSFFVFFDLLKKNYSLKQTIIKVSTSSFLGLVVSIMSYNSLYQIIYRKVLVINFVSKECGPITGNLVADLVKTEDLISSPRIREKIERFNFLYENKDVQEYLIESRKFDNEFIAKIINYSNYVKRTEEFNLRAYKIITKNKKTVNDFKLTSQMNSDNEIKDFYVKNPDALTRAEKFQKDLVSFFKNEGNIKEYNLIETEYGKYKNDKNFLLLLNDYSQYMKKLEYNEKVKKDINEMYEIKKILIRELQINLSDKILKPIEQKMEVDAKLIKPIRLN